MQIQQEANRGQPFAEVPQGAQVLIACDDESAAERLNTVLREAGLPSESVRSMTEACSCAKSGRFQVVVSSPTLKDGSWERLLGIAQHFNVCFEIILLARNFDLMDWAEALKKGAFDVLDATREIPKSVKAIRDALRTAYLKGAGPHPALVSHRAAA